MPTLLLIDDDPVFLTMLARSLKRRGWDSLSAHDEAEALSLLAAPPAGIDGVLLDLNLAGYSGLRLIGPVREALPTVPVVVLTGYASIATAVDAIKLGATQYLAKPADTTAILAALAARAPETGQAPPPEQTMSLKRLSWEHVQRVLAEHDGNISATARALHMHRRTLQRMLQKRPVQN
ncbi:response regulator [Laribacter hongkongensis]|uniref:response regulator transcription factor n=1 Tax=Laribacter hongkongensis TaxID=168471 RepID=UPI001EFDAB51|nr:response regulator [Laribacter hongkongensis]MCG8995626.1 response regulator [Laribacter hongkongensis]MCG9010238.1 response regulator [Laribacter hongkongensis]MCG9023289.1 response regulator [Laribacter hongkongensis]MCG9047068.1 response regulator [Laribacter hongkongensis]MCG9055800.1 response regulator [Laribacter hongkongensis]